MFHRGRDLSLRRTVLLATDLVGVSAAFLLAPLWRFGPAEAAAYIIRNQWVTVACIAIFLVVYYGAGMYERAALTRRTHSYRLPMVAVVVAMAIVSALFYANARVEIGRGVFLIASLFAFLFSWITRHMYAVAVGKGLLSRNTLLVGEGRDAARVLQLIRSTEDSGIKVLGMVTDKRTAVGAFMHDIPVVGHTDKLRELVDAFDIETLVVATSLSREPAVLRQLRPMRCSGIEIMDYVTLWETLAQEIPLDHINDEWLMNAALNSSVIHIRKMKRILDFMVASIGLLLASPICLIVAPLIKLDSPGPVLYRQRRSGKDGGTYMVMKFRTMRQDAEAGTGAVWSTGRSDARITRIGNFLRKWRIDEIPQLINVMKGEMSLVGPRPERPEFVQTLSKSIPFYTERLMVPPGVTGWAQVMYPYAATIDGSRRKLQFDLYYIKHMGLMLDCLILLRTIKTVIVGLRHEGNEESETIADKKEKKPVIHVLPASDSGEKTAQSA
ncbi:MAG: sugar transferase [Kiritimatiellia bacterium]|jgi:exopolysaccharide biosynthesis polyprenyl glycosylphosphotransferase